MANKMTTKETLRKTLRARRRDLFKAAGPATFEALAENFLQALPSLFLNTTVAGYYPLGSEIDPLPLLAALEQSGVQVALPVVVKENTPLDFRAWKAGGKLKKGPEGAMEPLKTAKKADPDIVLVPILGFDEAGNRLGQGKGYFDRTLEALRKQRGILAVGLAFEGQREKALPFERHDQDLDAVITEAGCWLFRVQTR